MKNLIQTIKKVSILILAISFMGCDNDEVTLPKLTAGFTHTIDAATGTVTFINTSVNASTYVWDFGDETSSTLINPVNVYSDGTYTVVLKSSNVAGAFDYYTDVITIRITEIAALPITFDNEDLVYEATTFKGATFEILTNPDLSGTNAVESNVGAVTNSGATYEGLFFELGAPVDLTTNKSIKMNFWSNAPIDVLLKLEQGTAGDTETSASHTGSGWEELMFTFSSSASYSQLTMFVDAAGTTDGTYYFDDITQVPSPVGPCTSETAQSLAAADFNLTFMSDPTASITSDGAGFAWIDNPDSDNAVNTSCKVGRIDRTSAAQYANNQIILDAKLDFEANSGFKLKVWSSTASTNVLLKLEDQTNAGIFKEVSATTSADGAGAWEELTFDFASADTNKFDKVVVFFELDSATEQTYYIDDLMLYGEGNGGGGGSTCAPETSQSLSATNFELTFQNDPTTSIVSDGAGFAWTDNPDFDNSVNTSCKVGQIDRTSAAQYANNQIIVDAKLDFDANSGFKLKVWSPTASTNVLLKLEDQTNAGTFKEVSKTTSAASAGEWEELTFDFESADSNKFDKIVLFFQLGTSIQETYYIDDLKLYGNGGGGGGGGTDDCPEPPAGELLANGDFEAGDTGCWQLFDGVTISTTVSNGGSQSAELQGSTGVAVGLKMERFGTGIVTPNTSYTVKFDMIASEALGEGGLVKAFTFSEGADGGTVAATQHILTDNTSSVNTSAWESKTFTFTTPGNANQVEGGLSFLIEIVNSAARLNVDNVSVRLTP